MSFNLKYASAATPHSWAERRPVVRELLRQELPTVIGTQEGLYRQLKDIHADLPEQYSWIGLGRDGGSRGEFAAVFYDARELEPLEFDHFWLSEHPGRIASRSWGNVVVRMATWVRFADRSGREFVVLNTHLDHQSERARRRAAELLLHVIGRFGPGLPVVVTGDFNTPAETSRTYSLLVGAGGLADTWLTARERLSPAYATFHGYTRPIPDGQRIDWILTSPSFTVESASISTFALDGQFPSDHLPIQAVVSL